MKTFNAQDVLNAWQGIYGDLEADLHEKFLAHPAMGAILLFPENWIRECLKHTPKLHKILKILNETRNIRGNRGKNVTPESREVFEQSALRVIDAYRYNDDGSIRDPSDRTDWWREQE